MYITKYLIESCSRRNCVIYL